MSLRKLMCVAGIVAMLIAVALPAFAQWDPGVEGYSQFRYEYSDEAEDGDFDTRRVRLKWTDEVNDLGTTACIQVDVGDLIEDSGGDNDVDLKDAWVSHPFENGWSVLLGFGDVYFGNEVPRSSSDRLPFERSMAANAFLPGQRALGVLVNYEAPASPFQFDLQAFDGMDAWHDAPNFSDAEGFSARAQYPFEFGLVGASYMTSDVEYMVNQQTQSVEPDVWGAHVLLDYNRIGFRGEYYDGDGLDSAGSATEDADGWYAQVNYTPETGSVTPFYRYDEFNYTDTTGQTATDVENSRHTLGVAYEPWANNRLTLQIADMEMGDTEDTTVGVQWQVSYD